MQFPNSGEIMGKAKKNLTAFLVLLLLLLCTSSCNTTEPPDPPNTPQPKTTLTLKDVSCLQAWIKLEIENFELPVNVILLKDSIQVLQINNLTRSDTIVYIDSLQPNQTYKFQSIIQPINQSDEVKSNELQVTTLAPTSQNFTWQVYSWGMHSSSEIRDIAIIDENNIWCVGEIYMNDSSGNADPIAYNGVQWNGIDWKQKKISVMYSGSLITPLLYGVYAFSATEIWFSSGVPIKGDGNNWSQYHLFDMGVLSQNDGYLTKIWGTSSSDLFYVGTLGTIAHYDGNYWRRVETGTDINFRDIYGSINKDNNELEIIALASNSGINQRKKIIRIKDQAVETLPDSGLANYLSTIWFISGRKYCIGGQGYYESNTFGPVWERDNTIPQFHITSIRGAGLNDIVLGGSFGLLMHYNGINWMNYAYITASYFDVISEVAIKGNTIVAAGFKGSKAVVMIGKR